MPKSLEKVQKHIAKKRNGTVEALHQYSRDSRRMHRASLRDDKLNKIASSRSKKEQPLLERVSFIQDAVRERGNTALDTSAVQAIVNDFIRQYEEDLDDLKKARRPGRPPSAKQDLVEMKIKTLKEEQKNGFYLPDLSDESNVLALSRWEGAWSHLTNISWVRVSSDGTVKPSSFPPA